jgi:hypothetical protein
MAQKTKKGRRKSIKPQRRKSFAIESDLMSENISRDNFKFLLATMYMYSHIWKVFHVIDELVIKVRMVLANAAQNAAQRLRKDCAAQTKCKRSANAAQNAAQTLCKRCTIDAQSMRNRCAIDAQSMRNRCAIAEQSMRKRYAKSAQTLRDRCAKAV